MRESTSRPVRRRHHLAVVLLAAGLAVLTACGGSTLSPKQVAASNAAAGGTVKQTSPDGTGPTDPTGPSQPGATPTNPGDDATVGPDPGKKPGGDKGCAQSSTGDCLGPVCPVASGDCGGISPQGVSCAGFKNGPGITDKTIAIGNSSDISGPVPGLFEGAQLATKAYVAYFNSRATICGRKLVLTDLDSRTDAGADQTSYQKLCETVFAAVGSMSAFDSGGAATAQKCGLPDMRSAAVTGARNACTTCYAAQNTGTREYSNAVYDFWVKHEKAATQKAAFLYLNAGASAENALTQIGVGKKRGMNFVYTSPIDIADFNYGPYVQQMKAKGVQWVQFLGAYQQGVRMAQAMQSNDFHPKVLMYDPSVYDQGFLTSGGTAVQGAYMFMSFLPLDSDQPEIALYRKWLSQVSPGTQPSFFGLFAWSAAKLFVEKAISLGGKLNRASLVASFRTVHAWTGGGAHAQMDVGGKHAPSCVRFMKVVNGKFVPYLTSAYLCDGYTKL